MPALDIIQLGLLIIARTTAFMAVAPVFSNGTVPGLLRAGLGVFLAILLMPFVGGEADLPGELGGYLFLVGKEVIVGLILGFIATLTFAAIRIAGELVDIHIGFAMTSIFDPLNQSRITVVGHFLHIFALLLFLAIDGHHILLLALSHSYELIPVNGAIFKEPLVAEVLRIFIGMFALGFKIAAPFIAVVVMSDIALGLVARVLPQLNVFILGFPMKAGLGMITLTLVLPLLAVIIGNILAQLEKDIVRIMELLVS